MIDLLNLHPNSRIFGRIVIEADQIYLEKVRLMKEGDSVDEHDESVSDQGRQNSTMVDDW